MQAPSRLSHTQTGIPEALGQSEAFLDFQADLSRVAPVNRPVLLLGERGTGKELAAGRLHFLSNRWQDAMVALNCAALTPTLIESELFGYEKGAFTGAQQRRLGRFEAAHGGTLFLDEIGTIPLEVQEKILRVVEYGVFERVGSAESIEVDVRIIAATNADLIDLSSKGRFKQDLLDRISFEVLHLPPLRDRGEDILLLANHFAARMAHELGRREIPQFSSAAQHQLLAYAWPGNVRELKNVSERAVYRSKSDTISTIDFHLFRSPYDRQPANQAGEGTRETEKDSVSEYLFQQPLPEAVRHLKIRLLRQALKRANFHQRKAAALLGLTYHQFRGLYRQLKNDV